VRVVLATRNAGKVAELQRILTGIELVALPGSAPEPVESGATFAENALIKARSAVAATGMPALADDSGLVVDALTGMPGVLSARWSGTRDDAANVRLVLAQLADVPDDRLGAGFVCAAAFVSPDGAELVEEAVWRGRLVREPRGRHGFGYDPIFVPEGVDVTSAELETAEKNAISHRARAFRALAGRLLSV
jgi:XTP/dITP diphosphohydrolase